MGRQNADQREAERKEEAERVSALTRKTLGSMPSSDEERRQQALDMLRKKAQARKEGKRVAVSSGVAGSPPLQAPPKRAKAPRNCKRALAMEEETEKNPTEPQHKPSANPPPKRPLSLRPAAPETNNQEDLEMSLERERARKAKRDGKKPVVEEEVYDDVEEQSQGSDAQPVHKKQKNFNSGRDRRKKPSEAELVEQLRKGIVWEPTRFVDKPILKEMEIDEDVMAMLEYMKVGSFYSVAYHTHPEVSSQFLSTLEATFYTTKHVKQGWGKIKFKVHGKSHTMSFKDIGDALGIQDERHPFLPKLPSAPKNAGIPELTWKLISGQERCETKPRSPAIRHPTVRYLQRLLLHTLFPKKEMSNVSDEELRFLHQALCHYASYPRLPVIPKDFYTDFGMVGFFVNRLLYYKDWAWTNIDSEPKIGIGGWITPLLAYLGIALGQDATGPAFLDASYLRRSHFFSGRFDGTCVYTYKRMNQKVEVLLPNYDLTRLSGPGALEFDISDDHILKKHGALGPMTGPGGARTGPARTIGSYYQDHSSRATAHLYGPPRYNFDQCTAALPHGPLRQAHEQISTLQRWSKAQDRTIFKLTSKCKELRRTVKRQAEASAKFMRTVADVLARGAVAGCKAEDFDITAFMPPQPRPARDRSLRHLRNPEILPSESGNLSPSLDTTDDENDSEGEASASSHAP